MFYLTQRSSRPLSWDSSVRPRRSDRLCERFAAAKASAVWRDFRSDSKHMFERMGARTRAERTLMRGVVADAGGATSRNGRQARARTRRRWATRRRWRWGEAAAVRRARCLRRRRPLRRAYPTGTSRARATPTPTRTTGASGIAARAPSGTCARRRRPASPRTPFDAAPTPRGRSPFIPGARV